MTNTPRKPTTVRHTRASILSRTSKAGTRPQHSILDQQTTEKKRRSLITTREALKQRPAWDMRGKISDLETQLEKNQHQLEGLHKFKNELTLLNQEKDSELKQALERVVAIKTELQMVGKTHAQEMEDQQARQRIHYQELKDQHLIYKRQEGTMEIMVEDARRKLKQAQSRMDQVTQERQQWQVSNKVFSKPN
ncbi:hypothetical protein BC941DRAFT_419780 [Chlamydoabsidia padenii]|nr:hypothetical protein BC941DRAFT_419780 [Chlamydoabsidia padenii]